MTYFISVSADLDKVMMCSRRPRTGICRHVRECYTSLAEWSPVISNNYKFKVLLKKLAKKNQHIILSVKLWEVWTGFPYNICRSLWRVTALWEKIQNCCMFYLDKLPFLPAGPENLPHTLLTEGSRWKGQCGIRNLNSQMFWESYVGIGSQA